MQDPYPALPRAITYSAVRRNPTCRILGALLGIECAVTASRGGGLSEGDAAEIDTGQTQGGWKQCTSNSKNPRKRSVRYLPRYVSAMKPPSNGVRQVVPAQVVTVFAAVGTPKCISSTKYVTKLMTTPKNAKLSRELDTAHGYVENSCNKKSYITYHPSKQRCILYIYI